MPTVTQTIRALQLAGWIVTLAAESEHVLCVTVSRPVGEIPPRSYTAKYAPTPDDQELLTALAELAPLINSQPWIE